MDLQQTNILIVDDSPPSLDILLQILRGFRVKRPQHSDSAEGARTLLSQARFDLIIIDCEMPGESGFSLTQHIRSQPNAPNFTSPIILMGGYTPLISVTKARDAGANIVIKKPVIPAVLIDRIERIARSSRPFVACDAYRGPDRRLRQVPLPEGIEERRAEALALIASPERAMSQDDVNSLFG